jgi:hypothetical protein
LDALVSLARALHVSLDALVFEEGESKRSADITLRRAAYFGPDVVHGGG